RPGHTRARAHGTSLRRPRFRAGPPVSIAGPSPFSWFLGAAQRHGLLASRPSCAEAPMLQQIHTTRPPPTRRSARNTPRAACALVSTEVLTLLRLVPTQSPARSMLHVFRLRRFGEVSARENATAPLRPQPRRSPAGVGGRRRDHRGLGPVEIV